MGPSNHPLLIHPIVVLQTFIIAATKRYWRKPWVALGATRMAFVVESQTPRTPGNTGSILGEQHGEGQLQVKSTVGRLEQYVSAKRVGCE